MLNRPHASLARCAWLWLPSRRGSASERLRRELRMLRLGDTFPLSAQQLDLTAFSSATWGGDPWWLSPGLLGWVRSSC